MLPNNKLQLTITKINNSYCVEMRDHYSNYACVYEPSVKQAMQYALYWFEKADEREQANQIHGKAVKEMIALDRKAGITTSMSDGLD
tara:strand:+ start:269 stop:529 length:261 start_codon:yes stop_codon:yes gene_type:complete